MTNSAAPFSTNNISKEDDTRHKEFENSIGNLLVAEYQVFRLRERIKNHLGTMGIEESSFMFKVADEWYKISVSAQRQIEPKQAEPEPVKVSKKKNIEQPIMYEGWFPEEEVGP